jgi:hypothetical protein
MILLPFGLLPILFFVVWMIWFRVSDDAQKHIGSKIREGITEFPNDISTLLEGVNKDELRFTEDGKAVVLSVKDAARSDIRDVISAKEYLTTYVPERRDILEEAFSRLQVANLSIDSAKDVAHITISLDDKTIRTLAYIEHEIKNFGRVFTRNSANGHRWLLYSQGKSGVEKKDGRLFVHISRKQSVPSFLETTTILLSERQITRNIKNRLWNRFEASTKPIIAVRFSWFK